MMSAGNIPLTSPVCVCFRAYIANRVTDKLTRIHDKIYCCRSVLLTGLHHRNSNQSTENLSE